MKNLLICSTEQSPSSQVNRFSASQNIPRNFWNPKTHHRMYNSPPSVPILSQIHLVHVPPPFQFLNIHINIILSSTPWSSMWALSLRFPNVSPVCTSLLPIRATFPAYLILLELITQIIFDEEYISLSSSLSSFLHFSVTSSL